MSDTPSGQYRIANVEYPYRYVSMSGNQFVGQDVGEIIKVDIVDNVPGLVTLYDTAAGVYIGVDLEVFQLSAAGRGHLEIHPQDVNKVWVLNNDNIGTAISVEPAPGSNKNYWTFEMVVE
ncbi:uncharacterized protein HD556DRAFT_1311629 [Suillus plorans]|uniref:Uncharacterized protein n=1 Tax=Suillus plorans TaxID=116603 RepID=A0A9P7DCY7_9AGAM|nr:uncharacterized protein HD556DRAFT_1311629 [Suillus plorans]KAG1789062.1 hypothetical protein HD556DRAFT_1311629 [Suillus plorans]